MAASLVESASLEAALSVPYVMDVSTCPDEQGHWVCRLEYEELPGCVAMSPDPLKAWEELEQKRRTWIEAAWLAGRPVPTPRPPLHP